MVGPDPPHPVLGDLFSDLARREVAWTLLRAPASLAQPSGDVDVLVAPAGVADLRAAAAARGFEALPGWESAANLILVTYHAPTRRWLVLDVVTTVGFRTVPGWAPPVAAAILARREVHDGVALPFAADAFWLLVLHCLLDRGTVAPHYAARLREPAGDSPLAAALRTRAPWAPLEIAAAARAGDWPRLDAMGARLAAELRRRRPPRERARAVAAGVAARARKPLLVARRRGTSLALLGPNGVGKSSVAAAVRHGFPLESRVIHMGLWKATGRGAAALRPLRVWRRYLEGQYHQLRGRLVIYDRYVDEARLPAQGGRVALKRPYFWLLAHSLPRPDATVVLDVPGAVAYGRKQENPPEELERERRVYRGLAQAQIVDASRDLAAVRGDVEAIVWRGLKRRWRSDERTPP